MIDITIIICCYNSAKLLPATLQHLADQKQTINFSWELLVINNASKDNTAEVANTEWSKYHLPGVEFKVLEETKPGVAYARIKGCKTARGSIIVFVDDDNLLQEDYLFHVFDLFKKHNEIAVLGGKSLPLFEKHPPEWIKPFWWSLALRDFGEKEWISNYKAADFKIDKQPDFTPICAGMALRKSALASYLRSFDEGNTIISRVGDQLFSGEDNDMVLHIIKSGNEIGYFPKLVLQHIMPEWRTKKEYIGRLVHDSLISYVELTHKHNINPWKPIRRWTLLPRKLKAYLKHRPWRNETSYINFKAACGIFNGLAKIK